MKSPYKQKTNMLSAMYTHIYTYECMYAHMYKRKNKWKKKHQTKQRSENKRQTLERNGSYQGHTRMYICYVQLHT